LVISVEDGVEDDENLGKVGDTREGSMKAMYPMDMMPRKERGAASK